ncbi:arginyl-tRNA synthetase [Allocoleopsis franciscana PCC 7113]|uniref:Arginyl-tRNA synthetase n=1 Tax=Allocoleopsis franciscana PCC 7113 TaxID=1173027 RepID=K9WC96_9CYAN|nr:arginyl-tRNA synthetase [Allocoleopsis franciscana PCC 7113]
MESKVTKNTSNCWSFSISLFGNSVAIKPVLQQQILASIALLGRSLVTNELPDKLKITVERIPVHRLSDDRGVIYRSAIALKLAPLWQLPPLDIAYQLAECMAIGEQNTADAETGNWEQQSISSQNFKAQSPIPSQVGLDFSLQVFSPGWIQFRLSDRGLATWLQQLIEIPPVLSHGELGSRGKSLRSLTPTGYERPYSPDAKIPEQNQRTETEPVNQAHSLFRVQYAHARCCSLLRLAHRQSLINLSDLDGITPHWEWLEPNPIPWLYGNPEMECSPIRLRLEHPAERGLIALVLDGTEQLTRLTPIRALELANALSHGFEKFYSACRIWGEVKTETPQLAQARLGLVAITQKLLRSLLQDQLNVIAPIEL